MSNSLYYSAVIKLSVKDSRRQPSARSCGSSHGGSRANGPPWGGGRTRCHAAASSVYWGTELLVMQEMDFSAVNAWDQRKTFGPEGSTGYPPCVPNPKSLMHSASQEKFITPCLPSEVPSRSVWSWHTFAMGKGTWV